MTLEEIFVRAFLFSPATKIPPLRLSHLHVPTARMKKAKGEACQPSKNQYPLPKSGSIRYKSIFTFFSLLDSQCLKRERPGQVTFTTLCALWINFSLQRVND
jgi:hypothetical protein